MRSSIFLADVTVVDHAYINELGQVIGGSFNPGFIVSGEVDPIEKVVVDFSTIKKDVKNAIDKHTRGVYENGFDHKLWIIEGFSDVKWRINDKAEVTIETPAFKGSVPIDAVRVIKQIEGWEPLYTLEYIEQAFEQHVYNNLVDTYPNIDIKVQAINTTNAHVISDLQLVFFTYSHGLKESTSYGCQNIFHGHLSYIQYGDPDVLYRIASDLNDAVFINKENITYEDDMVISIEYETPRGAFKAKYTKDRNNIIAIDTETTIEYIAEYVSRRYDITGFLISEGLSKGTTL